MAGRVIRHTPAFPLPMITHMVAVIVSAGIRSLVAGIGLATSLSPTCVATVRLAVIAVPAGDDLPTTPSTPEFPRLRSHAPRRERTKS
jgi:hypothetical protein